MKTTCQICGRAIKAKNGWIAHRGYTRPGHGWQTGSCFGARFRPYEVAHDALDTHIGFMATALPLAEASLAAYKNNPPEELDELGSFNRGRITHKRPEGFDGNAAYLPHFGMKNYGGLFRSAVCMQWIHISQQRDYLGFITARREAWTPPQ